MATLHSIPPQYPYSIAHPIFAIHCCLLYHIFQFEVARAAAAFIFNAFYVQHSHSQDIHIVQWSWGVCLCSVFIE